ncbi:Sulfoacetaldehyde reductase 2 [Serratia marcescens]|nr:Sulfoacetaldehyde reductase 2 [Serratia marcescens]CAE7269557.1 Sulfoacetaldehyde reductase 2 [Serratia marcescens]CAH3452123.1 Sulfoacetaldehyde reductase 2 [Serratia marcescens]CAI1511508.1 NADP-dependent 3-hydroxy acid dehydrogenase YdfG [Serratia marcescens]CAI1512303.1 NADP-dependent 3-hydroxy acid dehydrogenase YdfG [Serratia marcescens]
MDFPRKVHALAMDITDKYSVDECLDNIPEEFENIIALINNAGLSLGFGPAQDNDISDWETMVNTNILALLHITRRMLEIFKIKNQGHIINIGSVAAYYPYIGSNVYGATKSFVHNFTLNLKTDLEGTNIRASCIAPGLSKTEFAIVRFKGDVEKADSLYEKKTYLTADNIAETVFWTFSLPANVNINVLEVMPTGQSFALGFTKKQDGK